MKARLSRLLLTVLGVASVLSGCTAWAQSADRAASMAIAGTMIMFLVVLVAAGYIYISLALQTIATKTGLSKSAVQAAIRHLRRRKLIDPTVAATTAAPVRKILRPWTHQLRG